MFLFLVTLSIVSEVRLRLLFLSLSKGSGATNRLLSRCSGLWEMCATDSRGGGDAAGGNGSSPSGVIRLAWMALVGIREGVDAMVQYL